MMFTECMTIAVLLGILIFMTARTGRRAAAVSLFPLLIVPGFYLMSAPVSKLLDGLLPGVSRMSIAIAITVAGLVIACVLLGMLCGNYRTTRARRGYLIMCGGFSAALAVVLIYDVVAVLG